MSLNWNLFKGWSFSFLINVMRLVMKLILIFFLVCYKLNLFMFSFFFFTKFYLVLNNLKFMKSLFKKTEIPLLKPFTEILQKAFYSKKTYIPEILNKICELIKTLFYQYMRTVSNFQTKFVKFMYYSHHQRSGWMGAF